MAIKKILKILFCSFICLGSICSFYCFVTNIPKEIIAHLLFWMGVFPILFFIFCQSIATIIEEINNIEYVDNFHDFIGQ